MGEPDYGFFEDPPARHKRTRTKRGARTERAEDAGPPEDDYGFFSEDDAGPQDDYGFFSSDEGASADALPAESPAKPTPPAEEPAWYEDIPRKGAAFLEGASLNALDNALPDNYGGDYLREAGHTYPTLRGLGTGATGVAALMAPGAQGLGGALVSQGILGAVAGGMGADHAPPEEVARATGLGALEGAAGGALGYVGGQLLGKTVGAVGPAIGRAGRRIGKYAEDLLGGPANRMAGVEPPPGRYTGPLTPNDLEQEWLARGRSIPAREMPVVKSNDPYSQALQRTRDELTPPVAQPGPPSLMAPSQAPPQDPFVGRAGDYARTPSEPASDTTIGMGNNPFVDNARFRAPSAETYERGMVDLPRGRGWRKNFEVEGDPQARTPWSEPQESPLDLAFTPPPRSMPPSAELPPRPTPQTLELDPSVPLTRRAREAPYLSPEFEQEVRYGIARQLGQSQPPAPPPTAAAAATDAPPAPSVAERVMRGAVGVVSPRAGRLVDRVAGPIAPLATDPTARALGQYGSELAWESSTGRAHGQDAEAWTPTKLSPSDEAKFQRDLLNGEGYRQWREEFMRETGVTPDPDSPDNDYDYRGAWKAGIRPEPYEFDGGRYHWASSTPAGKMLKAPDHPTAWMEHFMRRTGVDPGSLGLKNEAQGRQYERERLAYADQATTNYALSEVLHSGQTGLAPADEAALTQAVVSGDDAAIRAADFRLRQRSPAYARRVERSLRALNEEE